MGHQYYFAYGSNLNRRQFSRRCPFARPIGRVTLLDYQLVFRRVADVVRRPGKHVEGMLYRITPPDELALDRYEGFPHLYTKRVFTAQVGKYQFEAMFYRMQITDIAPPHEYYLQTIEEGYHDWKIPYETLDAAVARSRARAQAQRRADPRGDGPGRPVLC